MTAELNWKAYDFARDLVADKKSRSTKGMPGANTNPAWL